MAIWKHLICAPCAPFLAKLDADNCAVLFGGFQDTGIRTSYLSDLWVWDTLEYKWHQIEISDVDRKPGSVPGPRVHEIYT